MPSRTRIEINQIKSQITLSSIIGQSVNLKLSRSRDWIGLCPFHSESTPSFHVDDFRYHCFGCQAHGDIFSWLKLQKKVEFPKAIELASELAGTTPTPAAYEHVSPLEEDPESRARIITINHAASRLFLTQRQGIGGDGFQYIHQRFNWKSLESFNIGFAPYRNFDLIDFLRGEGFKDDHMLEAQLCARDYESGKLYPRYQDRIMIPLTNALGQTLGFLGRILPSQENSKYPKYLCPRNDAAFNKKSYIFGLDRLNNQRVKSLIVTEGCIDAISLIGRGQECVVSTMGCHLSEKQLEGLSKFTSKIYMMYDGDRAGVGGIVQANTSNLHSRVGIRALLLPSGEDPDTFSRKSTNIKQSLANLPNVPVMALSLSRVWITQMTKPEYDTSVFDRLCEPYARDNIEQGWPQYNIVDWCMQAYPEYSQAIKEAALNLVKNSDSLPNGKLRIREEEVKLFIKEWIKPCRDVRRAHAN